MYILPIFPFRNGQFLWLFDALLGYHQLAVDRASQEKLAFQGPDAIKWTYRVMPFGSTNWPATFICMIYDVDGQWKALATSVGITIGNNTNTRIIVDGKMGGLMHIQHNDVADEWRHLCATAFSPCRVEHEPWIFSSISCRAGTPASNTMPPSSTTPTAGTPQPPTTTEERGDASCHGFWERGRTCIFDMRTYNDPDAKSYQKKESTKFLEQHEKEKKDKYLQNCLEMWEDFTPMVYSVDGIAGREARNVEKRLATQLAGKWQCEYLQIVYYARVRMAIAVVQANSLLIRSSRDRQQPRRPLIPDGAALGDWQIWQDQ